MEDVKKVEVKQKQSDAILPGVGNDKVNDTSIPLEINGDDEVQQIVKDSNYPHDSYKKINKSIYPSKEDRVPMKDRVPSEIRNDDNPADVDI